MKLIWATRGRTWGFRFLLDGGLSDPLPAYDVAFSGAEDEREVCRHGVETVALRFLDPLGRQDAAGRVIPHEFVAFPPLTDELNSVEDGLRLLWPLVADEYEQMWASPQPPAARR